MLLLFTLVCTKILSNRVDLVFFCCYQPSCVVRQQSFFWAFLFHIFSSLTPPPPQTTKGASIKTFLKEVQKTIPEIRRLSGDDLMLIKGDLILPIVWGGGGSKLENL